jgi:hypothetical protein
LEVERSLNFGERWRYHLRFRGAYQSLLLRLSIARSLDPPKQQEPLEEVLTDLEGIHRLEANFPAGDSSKRRGGQ